MVCLCFDIAVVLFFRRFVFFLFGFILRRCERKCWQRFLRWPPQRIFRFGYNMNERNSLGEKCKINKNTRSHSFKAHWWIVALFLNMYDGCMFSMRRFFRSFCRSFLHLSDMLLQVLYKEKAKKQRTKRITFTH